MSDLDDFRQAKDEWMRTDPQSPLTPQQRRTFAGLSYYDENAALRVVLRPDVFDDPEVIEMPTSTGDVRAYERWARLHFEVDGAEAALTVFRDPDSGHLFLPFVDANAGGETYGAGRYLEAPVLDDERLLVDFNYAYNPYCAYNEAYSCPIPPAENRLDVAIRAGERVFDGEAAEHRH